MCKPTAASTYHMHLCRQESRLLDNNDAQRYYFVHSYRALPTEQNKDWVLSTSHYGEDFISALQRGDTYATQFHPEKSGAAGLKVLENFFKSYTGQGPQPAASVQNLQHQQQQPHPLNGKASLPCIGLFVPIKQHIWQYM